MKHRCTQCNKLLAVGTGAFEIKCPRCKTLNRCRSLTSQSPVGLPKNSSPSAG
nr:MAG TPA: hypothetical protein [Caudoviricetes sp.]